MSGQTDPGRILIWLLVLILFIVLLTSSSAWATSTSTDRIGALRSGGNALVEAPDEVGRRDAARSTP